MALEEMLTFFVLTCVCQQKGRILSYFDSSTPVKIFSNCTAPEQVRIWTQVTEKVYKL